MTSGLVSAKIGFEESLGTFVIGAGKCLGCGACVIVCPFGCLEYSNANPVLVKDCTLCGICPKVCPQYNVLAVEIEKLVFGRERQGNEDFGIYRKLVLAQATDVGTLNAGQDGGLVTALLVFALENGFIDGAIVSGISSEKNLLPIPKLATTSKEILESAGTRYFYSPNILALAEVAKQKKTKVAFVGTPCQIRAIRKMQLVGLKKRTDSIRLLIGLMCSESFTYDGLMEKYFQETLKLSPTSVKKVNIKGKMRITSSTGTQAVSLSEVKQFARNGCNSCGDFSSELADISAGGLGLDKWTFTIIRTEKGEQIFSEAANTGAIRMRDEKEEPNALSLLHKLSNRKKQNVISKQTT